MHRCLSIHEILESVAWELSCTGTQGPFYHQRPHLLRMALVCRAFLDPALDAMWRFPPSLKALVHTLPQHALSEKNGKLTVEGASSRDWERFMTYARRVRMMACLMTFNLQGPVTHPGNVDWSSLARHFPGERMLPNVHTFLYVWDDEADIDFDEIVPLLAHAPLAKVHLVYPGRQNTEAIRKFIEASAQTIKSLILGSCTSTPQSHCPNLFETLCSLDSLIDLQADFLRLSMLKHVRSRTSLRRLVLEVDEYGTIPPIELPVLHTLEMSDLSPDTLPAVHALDALTLPGLLKLDITVSTSPRSGGEAVPPSHLQEVFPLIARFSHLRTLILRGLGDIIGTELPQNGVPALQQLYVLRQLASLHLEGIPLFISGRDIDSIVRAWPHMRSLRLCENEPSTHAALQLEDLLPFALHYTKLEVLAVRAEVREGAAYETGRMPFGTSTSRVKTLDLGVLFGNAAGTYSGAAEFLACAFPCAQLTEPPGWMQDRAPAVIINNAMKVYRQQMGAADAVVLRAS